MTKMISFLRRICVLSLLLGVLAQGISASISPFDSAPFYSAVCSGEYDNVQKMLDAGFDANTEFLFYDGMSSDGIPTTALNTAVSIWKFGNVKMCELLVKHGADVNQRVNGFTPLLEAVIADNLDCVKFLLAHGANVKLQEVTQDKEAKPTGWAPLHFAQSLAVARELVAAGALYNERIVDVITRVKNHGRVNLLEFIGRDDVIEYLEKINKVGLASFPVESCAKTSCGSNPKDVLNHVGHCLLQCAVQVLIDAGKDVHTISDLMREAGADAKLVELFEQAETASISGIKAAKQPHQDAA